MREISKNILGYSEGKPELRPLAVGLSKQDCHDQGMEMRKDGKVCFCVPNKDDPQKRDLMVP